jgi:hypothetical protein
MDEDLGYLRDQRLGWKNEDCFVHSLSSVEEYPASSSVDFLAVSFETLETRVCSSLGQRRYAQGRSDQKVP